MLLDPDPAQLATRQRSATRGARVCPTAGLLGTPATIQYSRPDSSGNTDSGISSATKNVVLTGGILEYGFRLFPGAGPETDTCTSNAATISGSESVVIILLNNQTSCALTFSGAAAFVHYFIFLEQRQYHLQQHR